MKKLFTLFCLFAMALTMNAQQNYRAVDPSVKFKTTVASEVSKRPHTATDRAASYDVLLDYDGIDELYATDAGFTYARFIWDLNKRWPNTEFAMDYAAVFFDSLMYADVNGDITFFPKAKTTVTVDSFDAFFIHVNNTGTPDTLKFTVFNTAAATLTGTGAAEVLNTPSLWDTTIITTTTIPLNTTQFTILTFYPNITLPQGQSFGLRVDFTGDTTHTFQVLAGYRDECSDACQAEFSYAGLNTGYYLNLTSGTNNFSGYSGPLGPNAVFYDCDQSGSFTVGGCENFPIQNLVFPAYITASVDYGVAITADSLRGCPGATLTLNANAFGSSALPYTYSWNTTQGTLTSTTDAEVGLIIGNSNATVTVTVTDANNATTTASVLVSSRGINISITNPNPLTINCGSNTTIATQISGTTTGKNYTWSTGASGANTATQSINQPGNYSVTVTNNSGCSASASLAVQYPGGLTNNVNFNLPPSPVCQGAAQTFNNTSARTNGWSYLWTFGDNNTGFSEDGVNTYAAAGSYSVKLEQDSAGCKFTSPTKTITVLPATNAACLNSVNDITFSNAISMVPNPTTGNVNITVNAVENNVSVKLYNIIGSELKSFSTQEVSSTFSRSFDYSDLPSGAYLVKIQSGTNTAIKRLTIQ
ncbi:MAG: T9SS type A sorting domain-containing protein [Bacteroidetes bacterium]|nr:T9SS type A sorting domain-containing protein [Bacteroidota bacterium]